MSSIFKRIDTVFVRVRDLEKAIQWYESVMGFKSTWIDMMGGYASFAIGETALTLARVPEGEDFKDSEGLLFNFYVDAKENPRSFNKKRCSSL